MLTLIKVEASDITRKEFYIDPLTIVPLVYLLEGQKAYLNSYKKEVGVDRRIDRLLVDLELFLSDITTPIARLYRDYALCAGFGEVRHYHERCSSFRWVAQIPHLAGRIGAIQTGCRYSPASLTSVLYKIFSLGKWESAFGGELWATIIKTTGEYGAISNMSFIDKIIDLQHNNGIFIDKGILLCGNKDAYRLFCTKKSATDAWYGDYSYPYFSKPILMRIDDKFSQLVYDKKEVTIPYVKWGAEELLMPPIK